MDEEDLIQLSCQMSHGSEGVDNDPNNPLSRAVRCLLEEGKPMGTMSLCFFGDLPSTLKRSSTPRCVRVKKQALGLLARETFVPQSYGWGDEAQVDWYEAMAQLGGELEKVQVFAMRSMASGGAFHRAYPCPTQPAHWLHG